MEIIIKGEAKEIAALILEVQEQQESTAKNEIAKVYGMILGVISGSGSKPEPPEAAGKEDKKIA